MIRDLPVAERPRERLAEKGAASLSSIELIAILLGHGTRQCSALELSSSLLGKFGSLEALSEATLPELCSQKGIGLAKAVRLHAAFALHKRLRPKPTRSLIDTPARAHEEIAPDICGEKTEVLCLLLRDARRGLIHKEIVGRGILNQVLIHPREIYCIAIQHRAHSLIIAHNHPSGDYTPSTNDLEMTRALRQAGTLIGIPLIDHLIITHSSYFSFWERGLMEGIKY
jgi:DNA repair protein RadC